MDNFFDSIKAILYERVNNPLVSGFATSWAIVNYKFFLIIFFGENLSHRLKEISILFNNQDNALGIESFWLSGLIIPLALTLFYIYVLPTLSSPVISFYYKSMTNLRNKKLENEGNELLPVEKSRALRIKLKEAETRNKFALEEAAADIEAHIFRIKQLEEKIASQEKIISQLREDVSDIDNELDIENELDLPKAENKKPTPPTRKVKAPRVKSVKTSPARQLLRGLYVNNNIQKLDSTRSMYKSPRVHKSPLALILPEDKDAQIAKKILYVLEKNKLKGMTLSQISNVIKIPVVEVDYYIKLLEKHGFLFSSLAIRGGNSAQRIDITDEGSQLVLDIIGEKK